MYPESHNAAVSVCAAHLTPGVLLPRLLLLLLCCITGVRSDVSRTKDGSYNPVGTGSAWSHNFLNQ